MLILEFSPTSLMLALCLAAASARPHALSCLGQMSCTLQEVVFTVSLPMIRIFLCTMPMLLDHARCPPDFEAPERPPTSVAGWPALLRCPARDWNVSKDSRQQMVEVVAYGDFPICSSAWATLKLTMSGHSVLNHLQQQSLRCRNFGQGFATTQLAGFDDRCFSLLTNVERESIQAAG